MCDSDSCPRGRYFINNSINFFFELSLLKMKVMNDLCMGKTYFICVFTIIGV